MFEAHTTTTLEVPYDVSHNLAKIEVHPIDGRPRTLCVHREGATRSLPPHHPELPDDLADVGQPVLIPGTMGTASYVLAGVPDNPAFFSTAHGRSPRRSGSTCAATQRSSQSNSILSAQTCCGSRDLRPNNG
ncbi:MAG: RtcB family protein [Mycobacterium sp.]